VAGDYQALLDQYHGLPGRVSCAWVSGFTLIHSASGDSMTTAVRERCFGFVCEKIFIKDQITDSKSNQQKKMPLLYLQAS
jgi:hypothetical protein